jgi:hypothetical protein
MYDKFVFISTSDSITKEGCLHVGHVIPIMNQHHVSLAQLVCGASLEPIDVASSPGGSTFIRRFRFTVEKKYVVSTKKIDEKVKTQIVIPSTRSGGHITHKT